MQNLNLEVAEEENASLLKRAAAAGARSASMAALPICTQIPAADRSLDPGRAFEVS